MMRLSEWIAVFTAMTGEMGMTWKVDCGPGSSPGQVFHRNDVENPYDEGERATRLPRSPKATSQ